VEPFIRSLTVRGAVRRLAGRACLLGVSSIVLVSCDVQIGDSDGERTVTEAAPTVTERTVVEEGSQPEQDTTPQSEGGSVTEAVARVEAEGYEVEDTSTYDPAYRLRVLIGTKNLPTSAPQRAFFFVGDDYLGTDTSEDSAHIEYAGQDDTQVSLSYQLFRRNDPNCCPTGGEATVRYQLAADGETLTPLDPIPSESINASRSRR
jgi:hypothetical protein